jgi:hypothetical protein
MERDMIKNFLKLSILLFVVCCDQPHKSPYIFDPFSFSGGIELYSTKKRIMTGETLELKLLLIERNGVKRPVNSNAEWKIEGESAVFCDVGIIEGRCRGTSRITGIYKGMEGSCDIEVYKPVDYSALKISEVFYDAVGSDEGYEYIEIYNSGDCDIPLESLCLLDGFSGSSKFFFPKNAVVRQGRGYVIAGSADGFRSMFNCEPDCAGLKFSLNNSGEVVFLFGSSGELLDQVYIEGGSSEYPAPVLWGSSSLPSAMEGYSVYREPVSHDSDSAAEWLSGVPTPGY